MRFRVRPDADQPNRNVQHKPSMGSKVEIDRIVLEHLPPKYDIYLIEDRAAPFSVTLNRFTIVAGYYRKQTSENSPFHILSEKRIRDLYGIRGNLSSILKLKPNSKNLLPKAHLTVQIISSC
jgi:hypothetical protein